MDIWVPREDDKDKPNILGTNESIKTGNHTDTKVAKS